MNEKIEFPVILPDDTDCDAEICVDVQQDTFDIILDKKIIFSGDWSDNLLLVLKRALELWPES